MGALRYDFTGECVLVTGASHGIGFAVARAFVRAGGRGHGAVLGRGHP